MKKEESLGVKQISTGMSKFKQQSKTSLLTRFISWCEGHLPNNVHIILFHNEAKQNRKINEEEA